MRQLRTSDASTASRRSSTHETLLPVLPTASKQALRHLSDARGGDVGLASRQLLWVVDSDGARWYNHIKRCCTRYGRDGTMSGIRERDRKTSIIDQVCNTGVGALD